MRRQWYIAFGAVLIFVFLLFTMLESVSWFFVFLSPILVLWIYDLLQKKHTILRNFPVLGHVRYLLEFIRPEIQQYFIASDESELPFNREMRSLAYRRAKNTRDTIPFGTEKDIMKIGYTWALHSMAPKHASEVEERIVIGGPECTQPYSASRLNISAMSFGSLSAKAITALNRGALLGDFYHNTGEGGISIYHLQGGDLVFQFGTGYFGCRSSDGKFDAEAFALEANRKEVKMIEIKLSQGAKPSHGGILPAAKLTKEIAEARMVPMGRDIVSPLNHSEFHTPIELLQFIQKIRMLSSGKPVGFKLCLGRHEEFLSICKAMLKTNILPDFITIDGAEGGTGAAPIEFANYVGSPMETGLVFIHNALVGINVRDKIRIICGNKVTNGFDLITYFALGADVCNSARSMMLATGCLQTKQCNTNTCPTGVATQSKRLQYGLVVDEKKHLIANFQKNTIKSFLEIVGALGLTNPTELKPQHIMRRVGINKVKSLDEIYEYLTPGALLKQNIPESYRQSWELADPEQF